MSKKKENKVEKAEKEIISWAEKLTHNRPGGLKYRINLVQLERWICVRKGLLSLKDMERL